MSGAELTITIVTIMAVLLSPFLAVHAQWRLEERRTKTARREEVFRVLMATRLAKLSPDHVHALNRIDLDFEEVKEVESAWREYRGHLNHPIPYDQMNQEERAAWGARGDELLVNLLYGMSKSLGKGFSRSDLASGTYRPNAHGWEEQYQQYVKAGVLALLRGDYALPVRIEVPREPEATSSDEDETDPSAASPPSEPSMSTPSRSSHRRGDRSSS